MSLNGFGYRSTCRATVGGVTVELNHSAATEADIGHTVLVHQLCAGKNHTECTYDRVVSMAWMALVRLMRLIQFYVLPVLFLGGAVELKFCLFGGATQKAV